MVLHAPKLTPQGYETQASALATALRGRWSRELRCWFFTPGRAKKWVLLHDAGFWPDDKSSELRFINPRLGKKRSFRLPEAVIIAKLLPAKGTP